MSGTHRPAPDTPKIRQDQKNQDADDAQNLRLGWTTGSCATAASCAAFEALITDTFPDPVTITLPDSTRAPGTDVAFALCFEGKTETSATVGVIKDAGDDPDITHGALIISTISWGTKGQGIRFEAGDGVGIVSKPGLSLAVGEPAINPVPRQMITANLTRIAERYHSHLDVTVTISIPGGADMAQKTWNPQLGIIGGLSILGTTGIVVPYSCSAWIHSIHRGIDVARATGQHTVVASTGATSQRVALEHYQLPQDFALDMGDFAGGVLKYVRKNPVPRLIIAGGIGKLSKLARGAMDLHSGRSQVETAWLADLLATADCAPETVARARQAASAGHVLSLIPDRPRMLGQPIALAARETCLHSLGSAAVDVRVLVIDRTGAIIGEAP